MQTIYLVPHTHYDVAWAFSKEEYLKINETILQEVMKLMEVPEFRFCLEQTFLLEAIEERNPELWSGLKEMIKKGERDSKDIIRKINSLIQKESSARIQYISIVDTDGLKDVKKIEGKVLIALAAYFGKTRLIDNVIVSVS